MSDNDRFEGLDGLPAYVEDVMMHDVVKNFEAFLEDDDE